MQKTVLISIEIDDLRRVIIESLQKVLQSSKPKQEPSEIWLGLDDLIAYDPENRTKATWYTKISKGEVPYHKKGKKLYFLKSEIDDWLRSGKCKSNADIEAEVAAHLSNLKRR